MSRIMLSILACLAIASPALPQERPADVPQSESAVYPVKYAIYSSAWGIRSNAGLRLVAHNQSDYVVELESILFRDESNPAVEKTLQIDLTIPAHGWAESEMPYEDLLFGNACVSRTMEDDYWELAEISNYPLNPSVRGLIIQNSDSFRIYQCVRTVLINWRNVQNGVSNEYTEWVMYHFERRAEF